MKLVLPRSIGYLRRSPHISYLAFSTTIAGASLQWVESIGAVPPREKFEISRVHRAIRLEALGVIVTGLSESSLNQAFPDWSS